MTLPKPSREPSNGDHAVTFADLIRMIQAKTEMKKRDREDVVSALRTICRVWHTPPEALPAQVAAVKARLKGATAAAVGLDPRRWSNVRSLTLKALTIAKLASMPSRGRVPMAPEYGRIFAALKSAKTKRALSRFFRWLSTMDIAPGDVTDETVARFVDIMVSESLMTRPHSVARTAVIEWNRAATLHLEWPQQRLSVPSRRDTYQVSWDIFPTSLKTEFFDGYLSRGKGTSLFSDNRGKNLRPATIKNQIYQVSQILSAFVHAGGDPAKLCDLKTVVSLDVIDLAMGWLQARNNGAISPQMNLIALQMLGIARHWVMVEPSHLDALKHLCRNTKQSYTGLAPSSREIMRQFSDDNNVMKILNLPKHITNLVANQPMTSKNALLMQTAAAVEVLIMDPVRIKSLSEIRIGVHIVYTLNGKMHLILEGCDTKNDMPNEMVFCDESAEFIKKYVDHYRPLLADTASNALFPGPGTATKYRKTLGAQISKHILELTGLRLTPQKFRHFLAKHYLRANAGGIGTVQQALGHRSADVTNRSYVGFQNADALRHVDEHVMRKRDASPLHMKRSAKKTPKSL
jgi:hypothetical protein